jgi:hypothetical protein
MYDQMFGWPHPGSAPSQPYPGYDFAYRDCGCSNQTSGHHHKGTADVYGYGHEPYMQDMLVYGVHQPAQHEYPVHGFPSHNDHKVSPEEIHKMKKKCLDHKHRYVMVETRDGRTYDGIVEDVDDERLYLAIPISGTEGQGAPVGHMPYKNAYDRAEKQSSSEEQSGDQAEKDQTPGQEDRQFVYGYPWVYPVYGYPFPRFQRFILPLAALAALTLLPYY